MLYRSKWLLRKMKCSTRTIAVYAQLQYPIKLRISTNVVWNRVAPTMATGIKLEANVNTGLQEPRRHSQKHIEESSGKSAQLPNVYIVGAHALGTDNATRTVRNSPKPPVGERTADMRPPILSPFANPVAQDGTAGADAVKAAPAKWGMILERNKYM